MKRKRKLTTQRRGAVLMTVTIITCMMVIIVGAGISLVGHTNARSNSEYRKKQAYFAAQSCLEAFVSQNTDFAADATHTAEEVQASIDKLLANADSGEEVTVQINEAGATADDLGADVKTTQPRWNQIDCKLRVERVGGDDSTTLRAVSTATYLGETKQVVAYMSISPLGAQKAPTRALEVIGTNGGGNASYNNLRCYGNSGAIDKTSHEKNTMYDASTNNCKLYGDCLIRGSFSAGVQLQLGLNPFYQYGVNDVETTDGSQTPGCSMAVTRILNLRNNSAKMTSQKQKDRTWDESPRGNNAFNYVYAREALVMQGDSATYIGNNENCMVDVYTSLFYVGKLQNDATNTSRLMTSEDDLLDNGIVTTDEYNRYKDCLIGQNGFYSGMGQEQRIYGNIYTEYYSDAYNGDIIFNGLHTHVYGDIYCEGDILGSGDVEVDGNVYMYGDVATPSIGSGMTLTSGHSIISGDAAKAAHSGSKRAKFPILPTAEDDCYKYFPEHMLVNSTASKIKNTYANFYKDDKVTLKLDNTEINSISTVSSVNQNGITYSDSSEEIRVVTKSCVVDKFGNDAKNCTYIVDLDAAEENADGRHDVVLLLKNSNATSEYNCSQFIGNNQVKILVNNHSYDENGEPDRFLYIVTDSGCDAGWVNNETASDPTAVSTYSHGSFKKANDQTLAWARKDYENYLAAQGLPASSATNSELGHHWVDGPVLHAGNGKLLLMEYDSYVHGIVNGNPLDPTDRLDIEGTNVLKTGHGNICMIFPEGSYIDIGQETILQASIYCPRATFKWINNAKNLQLIPDPSVATYPDESHVMNIPVNILGCLICGNFQSSANNNHVVYQQVSSNSMLPLAKGPGKSIADKAFKLLRYDWS